MKTIWTVARNTFTATIRDRLFYALIAFAGLVIAGSLLAGSVSLGQDVRVIENFSLTALLVFLLIIVLFLGTQLINREINERTIYLSLTKPLSREQFYLGKYLGLCLCVAVSTLLMSAAFLGVLYLKAKVFPFAALWAIGGLLLEAWLLIALSFLFGSFTSPLASAVYTFCLVLIGHSSNSLWALAQKSSGAARAILEGVYYLFPNLEKFNFRNEVIFNLHPGSNQLLMVGLYFVGYTAFLLLLGTRAFRRHEF